MGFQHVQTRICWRKLGTNGASKGINSLYSFTLNRIFKFDRLKRLIIYAYCISLGGLSTGISPQTVTLWPQSLNIRIIQKVLRMQLPMF